MSKGRRKPGRSGSQAARRASPTSSSSGQPAAETTEVDVAENPSGFTPLTVEEAQALMTEALTGVDRSTLLAERAEAEAQLRAAEATLGNGLADAKQEPDEPAQKPLAVDGSQVAEVTPLDVDGLRRAAASAREADEALAAAAAATLQGDAGSLPSGRPAETAIARALQIRENVPAAWRRLVGALISATGMAIVIGALGWNIYWLLVPIALIAIMTVDLRVAGRSAREATAEVAQELASVGGPGPDELERIRQDRAGVEENEARLAAARAERDAAYARFEELAPGRLPSEVEEIIASHEADLASAQAAAEAEAEEAAARQAAAEVGRRLAEELAAEAPVAEAEAQEEEEEEEETAPATASEWWFGSREAPAPPPAAPQPVRALAERLSTEGREALARIEAQLAALERVDLAKRSLEWHEANGSGGADGTNGEKP